MIYYLIFLRITNDNDKWYPIQKSIMQTNHIGTIMTILANVDLLFGKPCILVCLRLRYKNILKKIGRKRVKKKKKTGKMEQKLIFLVVLGTNRGIQPMLYTQTGVEYENIRQRIKMANPCTHPTSLPCVLFHSGFIR